MRFISLFAGIGGIDLGLERAGHECAAQVEWDPWCQQILAKHWPDVPRWSDINDIEEGDLPDADIVAGGFPCQPVSLAGARLAQDDPRWLWPAFARIVRMVEPRHVIVENVPGLASAGMGDVLGDLASLGFDAEWESIPAAAVGAPHLRYRIFIVATHSDSESESGGPVDAEPRPGIMVPDAEGVDGQRALTGGDRSGRPQTATRDPRPDLADADGQTRNTAGSSGETGYRPEAVERLGRFRSSEGRFWAVEPDVGRVAHGIPRRMDRLRGLGNAVVPQVAQYVAEQYLTSGD